MVVNLASFASTARRRDLVDSVTSLSRQTVVFVLVGSFLFSKVLAEEHCSEHMYNTSLVTDHMQFTKEVPDQEYAVLGQFKSLHCCAKGYRSIEWFKNGQPYPWGNDISSLIVNPDAANQTIHTPKVSETDIGNYTCVLRNDTSIIRHEIEMRLQEDKPDYPLPTFRPKDTIINLGETARLYCEAFVGKLDLPDATNKIVWMQTFDDKPVSILDANQLNVTREDGQIIGSYLSIPNVQQQHYGRYRCQITSGNQARPLELNVLLSPAQVAVVEESELERLVIIVSVVVFIVVMTLLCIVCRTDLRKHHHDNRCSAQFIADNENV